MRKGRDGGKNGGVGGNGEIKKKRLMIIVAATSLPAVDWPTAGTPTTCAKIQLLNSPHRRRKNPLGGDLHSTVSPLVPPSIGNLA